MNKEKLPQIGVSETLRMSRERTGQDLRYVADMLRIRYAYLEAIENGEYQKLPGAPYAIGFVRAYADHLNLNSVEIVERFKRERADLDEQTQLVFPKPLPEGKVPSGGILLVAVVLGVFVYGAWFFLSGQDKPIVELIPEIPARLMALVGAGEDDAAEPVEAEPVESGADADGTMAGAPADEEAAESPVAETDAPDGPPAPDAAATEADVAAEPAEPAETAGTVETTPEPATPAQSAPVAEEPATAAMSAPESDETPASTGESAAEPTAEADAETAEGVSAPAVPPLEPEPDEAAEAAETPAAVAETEAVAEPGPPAETGAGAASPETGVAAPEPAPGDEPVAAATETADDDGAAAIAQRVLEELGRSPDQPADADAPAAPEPRQTAAAPDDDETPVSPGAGVNGDPVAAGPQTDEPSEDVPVAAIAPAARTPEAPEPAETAAAAPDNGAGPSTPSIMAARPSGKIYGEENEKSRILITARVDSWVEVSTQQGELLLTRVLRAGDSFRVPDRAGLLLVTGNAGGLAISVDGNQVPDLGPVGAVRRGVELDPDSLIAGTAGNL